MDRLHPHRTTDDPKRATGLASKTHHRRLKHRDTDEPVYDRDGFDSYGYDKDEVDRAGNPESDYFMGWYDEYDNYHDDNAAYDNALESWGFDGVRPVARK